MEASLRLNLLYTANLGGHLALLPRLQTFLQRLSGAYSRRALRLDLGGACSDSMWHCRATGNRSMLIVLDAMGYHAANVQGSLKAEDRDKLAEQVTLALVDAERDWRYPLPEPGNCGVNATLSPKSDGAWLQVLLKPAKETRLDGTVLRLESVSAGQVGEATIDLSAQPRLESARIHRMPSDTPTNPSITGTVEFVESEARLFQSSQS